MANIYWGPSNSVWSDTNNWYDDAGYITPAGRKAVVTDDAWFGAAAGNCTLDGAELCASISLWDGSTIYSGTFDMDGFSLAVVGGDIDLAQSGSATWLMPGSSELSLSQGSGGESSLKPFSAGMTLGSVSLISSSGGSTDTLRITDACTITALRIEAAAGGTARARCTAPGGVDVLALSVTGAGGHELVTSNIPTRPFKFHCNVDFRDFTVINNICFLEFGFDSNITITLNPALDFFYGMRWVLINSVAGANRTILITASPSGNLYLSDGIYIENRGDTAADLHVFFWGDIEPCWTDTSRNLNNLIVNAPTYGSATTRLTFVGTNLLWRNDMDLSEATEINGSGTPIITAVYSGTTFTAPDDVPMGLNLEVVAGARDGDTTVTVAGRAIFWGYVKISTNYGVWFGKDATLQVIGAYFETDYLRFRWDDFSGTTVRFLNTGAAQLQFTLIETVRTGVQDLKVCRLDLGPANVDLYGVMDTAKMIMSQTAGYTFTVHAKAADGQYIKNTEVSALADVVIDLDDPTAGVSDYGFFFNTTAGNLHCNSLTIQNSFDSQFHVQIHADETSRLSAGSLTVTGRGDVCAEPITDDYVVSIFSDTPGSPAAISVTSESAPTLVKFTDIAAQNNTIFADDGTGFDGGGNSNISFDITLGSVALCPLASASFSAVRYADVPDAQQFSVRNIGVVELAEPVAAGLPAWLDASFSDNGDGTWTMTIQPNTTDLAAAVYTDTFTISVTAARRSPATFSVAYTTANGIVPLPTVTEVDFYQLRQGSSPSPQTITVNNAYAAGGTLQQITVTGLPSWLDIAFTVPGPADQQKFSLTVNAAGLALAAGTYNANLVVGAPNAAGLVTLPVELIVDRILVDTDVSQLLFSMRVGGALPEGDVFNISNSGTAGTLTGITVTPSEAWLDIAITGEANNLHVLVELNAGAQALAAGVHTAQLVIASTNADNVPYTVDVELTVDILRPFTLNPIAVLFTPGRDWAVPAAQQVVVGGTGQGSFAAPVTITGTPDWLQTVVDATDPERQIITLTPLSVPLLLAEFEATLTVTGSYALDLPVSVTVPAYFRRSNCQMEFIPQIEGTIIEECTVPPPPAPAPVTPALPPPQASPTYPAKITMTGPPCIDCSAYVEFDDEDDVGYAKPHFKIDCSDHGCDGSNMEEGSYGGSATAPGVTDDAYYISTIEIDECGHICFLEFQPDNEGGSL